MMRIRKLGNAEIALAMELRDAGVYWHHIAEGLGVDSKAIRYAVAKAKVEGAKPAPTVRARHIKSVNAKAKGVMYAS